MKADARLVFEPTAGGIQEAVRYCCALDERQIEDIASRLEEAYRPYSLEQAAIQMSRAIGQES
jgi:hypothetical protein